MLCAERVPAPLTVQVTPLLPESLVTAAERDVESLGSTVAVDGETVTLFGGLAHPEITMMARSVTARDHFDALIDALAPRGGET